MEAGPEGGLLCEDRNLDGPASGGKGSEGRNKLDLEARSFERKLASDSVDRNKWRAGSLMRIRY